MRTINASEVQWQRFSSHRPGFARNKRLLSGEEGSPTNFEMSIVECQDGYGTPRHHHNFDQFRYMLKGRFGVGDGLVLEEGTVSYFTEGVHYVQEGIGTSHTLLLQFGGASGNGFMSYAQLERGHYELSQKGTFKDGIYQANDAVGVKGKKDAYEAIWEHVNEREVSYPEARYAIPVVANADNLGWVDLDGAPGVSEKCCGYFTERAISMGFIKVEAQASYPLMPKRLYYLLSGAGTCGEDDWSADCAIDPENEDGHVFTANEDAEFLYYDRPRFPDAPGDERLEAA